MRGRYASDRQQPSGPHPDWNAVEWFIYQLPSGRYHISATELLRSKKNKKRKAPPPPLPPLLATVRGTSRKTVIACLRRGIHPGDIQKEVAKFAEAQAERVNQTEVKPKLPAMAA